MYKLKINKTNNDHRYPWKCVLYIKKIPVKYNCVKDFNGVIKIVELFLDHGLFIGYEINTNFYYPA